ncbi:MAG TPA: cation-translocating P-type ATPase [Macromonas sp.]|nr:cation-translocating P-type ATPase [Macromonas sp.]
MPNPVVSSSSPSPASALSGLSSAEARQRLAQDGPNLLPGSAPKSGWSILRQVLTEPMFLMLLVAGGIYLLLGDRAEAAFLLSFVFVVIAITLAQERRTQRALESLRDLSAPRALVLRDGQELRVPGRDVVCGDLLVLHEGDRIAADAQLLEGQLEVDESLLTGEAVPVAKLPGGAEGADRLCASTVVTRGVGVARVTAIGTQTEVGRIGADLATTVEPPSQLQQNSRTLVRWLGLAALGLACAQVLLAWGWNRQPMLDSLLSGIALAMAILPEEIPVILTVFLALGAWRLAQQQVLTRRVTAVEALGSITVLAVDKTGTLTVNRMAVAELATDGHAFLPDAASELPEVFHRLTEFAMLATPGDPFDPMEKAIQRFGHQWLGGTEHVHDDQVPVVEYPLSGEMLAMTRVFSTQQPGQHLLATKGAPEAVADLCHLDDARRVLIRQQIEAMAERGLRVLGVACGHWQGPTEAAGQAVSWPLSQHDFDFEFLGLVALADPPRADVPAALQECRRAGVRVIMMTGDHPATARAIAHQVGLSPRPEVITGAEIDALDDAALSQRLHHVDLCARLRPEHKLRLVHSLRASGEVVAMTGDGVNDAPALKAADVGIAMGERGTDVAREAAALVLLDDSFARIVEAIRQGRRIYDNVCKATRFVFAVHVPIIALTLVPTLLHWPVLLPVHLVLLELLIDPACSIVFEAEPADSRLMTRPPRATGDSPFAWRQLWPALLQGGGMAAVLLAGHAWMVAQGWAPDQARAVAFTALVLAVMLLILANRDPVHGVFHHRALANLWVGRMAAGMAVLLALVLGVPMLRDVMGLATPPVQGLAVGAVLLLMGLLWVEALRLTLRGRRV